MSQNWVIQPAVIFQDMKTE